MKILDGCQFQNKNPIKEPIMPNIDCDNKKDERTQIERTEPDKMPSSPSIKLQKLMIPVQIKIIRIIKKNSIVKLLLVLIRSK